jgi:hypothetical protein
VVVVSELRAAVDSYSVAGDPAGFGRCEKDVTAIQGGEADAETAPGDESDFTFEFLCHCLSPVSLRYQRNLRKICDHLLCEHGLQGGPSSTCAQDLGGKH